MMTMMNLIAHHCTSVSNTTAIQSGPEKASHQP